MLFNCGVRDYWEALGVQGYQTSQSQKTSVLNIHWKDWCWNFNTSQPPDVKNWLILKDPDAGQDWRQEDKGMAKDDMVVWHHQLDGHEFEQALGVGDGQGNLTFCSQWGYKESDMAEWLSWTKTCIMKVNWGHTAKDMEVRLRSLDF